MTTDDTPPELAACPFCGAAATMHKTEFERTGTALFEIGCSVCDTGTGTTAETAIAAWNQRATPLAGSPQAEMLHAQIMNLPCKPYDGTDAYTHYCRGHRDARHAAAELALAAHAQPAAGSPQALADALRQCVEALERLALPIAFGMPRVIDKDRDEELLLRMDYAQEQAIAARAALAGAPSDDWRLRGEVARDIRPDDLYDQNGKLRIGAPQPEPAPEPSDEELFRLWQNSVPAALRYLPLPPLLPALRAVRAWPGEPT